MLSAIRQFSKSWIALILFMLLLVSLMIWGGMGNMLKNPVSSGVVSVGAHEVSASQFEQQFSRQLEAMGRQQGQPVNRDEAVKAGLHTRLLQETATQLSFVEAIRRLGIQPSPRQFAEKLQEIPAFFDEITGQFDRKKYRQLLAENKVDEKSFEQQVRDDIGAQHFGAGLQAGLVAPRAFGALVAISELENRSWSSVVLDASKVPPPAKPTDAQLTAFMAEFGDRLRKPETRQFQVVKFSSQAIEAAMAVDPAELQKLYNFRKDTMTKPEMRTLVQIPAKTAAVAQTIQQRLAKGEDPTAVAKAVGVEPVTYLDKPKTAISDRKVADAAFALPAGQVSGPIQGELGLAVVKVIEVKPALTTPFEQARPELEKELKHDNAQKQVYAQVESFEKAHDGGANLADAAKAVGATVLTIGPISQDGRDAKGAIPTGLTPRMATRAFEMAQGEESDIEDEGNGEYFAVRLDQVTPSTMRTLDEVRPQLTDAYMKREQRKAMQAKADEMAARVRKGESLEAVAASVGASVSHAVGVDRRNAQKLVEPVGVPLLQAVFGGAKGEVVVAEAPKFSIAVARIDDVQPGPIAQLAPMAEISRRRATGEILQTMADEAQAQTRKVLKPRVDAKKAAQALGVSPDVVEEPKKDAPAKKAKG
jgi:peptidyl-prolyl cis-trans isomerase D